MKKLNKEFLNSRDKIYIKFYIKKDEFTSKAGKFWKRLYHRFIVAFKYKQYRCLYSSKVS